MTTALVLALTLAGLAAIADLAALAWVPAVADVDDPIPLWPTELGSSVATPGATDDGDFYEWADRTMLLFAGSDRDDQLHDRRMNRP